MSADPYKYFRIEARELTDSLGQGALVFEKGQGTAEELARLLRLAHTLKGAARVVKQKEIADLAHAVEDVLAPFKDTPSTARPIDELLSLIDAIAQQLAQLSPPPTEETRSRSVAPVDDSVRTVRADLGEMDVLLEGVSEVGVQLAAIRHGRSSLDEAGQMLELLTGQPAVARSAKSRALAETLKDAITSVARELDTGLEQTDRELRQVRESAERLRLVPASAMFVALERTARDAAVSLRKKVGFEPKGGDVTLDADVIGAVQHALVQAVRNAVAHGIEQDGTVTIEVSRRGNKVAFTCRDDGRGVDLEAVRRAAQRRGVSTAGMGEVELLRLLLHAGISTSAQVTEVAGRGIGLDVVRETANKLQGVATLSRVTGGRGTSLELVVPVSLSSLEALVVLAGQQRLAIPLEVVRGTSRVTVGNVRHTAHGDTVLIENELVPFFHLARFFGAEPRVVANAYSVVLVEASNGQTAVGADELLGTYSLVLRPLPNGTGADATVAGASLDSEGTPQLVLDPDGLAAHARHARPTATAQARSAPILVIDDSLTTRMLEQSILESAGYAVDLATSAEEGLEKARARTYALFLVDVEMPGMDGFSFVATCRADAALRPVPAILVTSRNAPEDRARGEAVGAQAYIVKSEFDQTDLLSRIRKLVAER